MVGAALCVCEGRLKLDSITRMLAYPDEGYHSKVIVIYMDKLETCQDLVMDAHVGS